jgi:hypothetical protein
MLKFTKALWWLLLCTIPFAVGRIEGMLSGYHCPPAGDCYNFAALAKRDLSTLYAITAIAIWPPCIWHLGGRFVFKKLQRHHETPRPDA